MSKHVFSAVFTTRTLLLLLVLFMVQTPVLAGLPANSLDDPVSPQGWVKVKQGTGAEKVSEDLDPSPMVLVEMGYPGVFSPRYLFPVTRRQMIGVGPILLPGLVGLAGEYRFQLILPKREAFSMHSGGGLVYYDISANDRSSSAAGVFLSLGTTYLTRSRFLLGGTIGVLNTTGADEVDPVESFGIRKGLSSTFVNFSVAYVF